MFSDGVVELFESGVITGEAKTLHRGKIVASFVLGSRALFDFVDNNPFVEFHPSRLRQRPVRRSRRTTRWWRSTRRSRSTSPARCAPTRSAARIYSGFGGQVDFIRGAARSRGGRPIIALPSTAQGRARSRASWTSLAEGSGVVTTRGDVHYVVTEYGVADLLGQSAARAGARADRVRPPRLPGRAARAPRGPDGCCRPTRRQF